MRRILRRNWLNWQSQTSPKKFLANWLELTEHVVMWGDISGEIDWIGTPKPLPKIPGKLVRVIWACSLGEEISQEK
jgi:hypothetical protein